MRLAVRRSISSPWHHHGMAFSKMLLLAVTHSIIFFTMNPSPLSFAVDEFLPGFLFSLFCFVWCFLVDKINFRSCVSPTATTRQRPVSGAFFFFFFFFFFSVYFRGHTDYITPSLGLGTERLSKYIFKHIIICSMNENESLFLHLLT